MQFYLYHETTRLSKQNATFRAIVLVSEARIITIMPEPPSNWPLRWRRAYKCPAFTPLLRSARPEGSLAIVVGPLLTMLIAYKCHNQGNHIQKSTAYGWKVYVCLSLRNHAFEQHEHDTQCNQSLDVCCVGYVLWDFSLETLIFSDKITFPIISFFWSNVNMQKKMFLFLFFSTFRYLQTDTNDGSEMSESGGGLAQ